MPFDASLYTRAGALRKAANAGEFSTRHLLRWWRAQFWLVALLTGAKSFADNPILGSRI